MSAHLAIAAVHLASRSRTTAIRDLGLIGNRRTLAAIDRHGSVVWYCPERFDRPSLFASLLDPAAGTWSIEGDQLRPLGRRYLGESAVLETQLLGDGGQVQVRDWMPLAPARALLCRELDATSSCSVYFAPRPDYGRAACDMRADGAALCVGGRHWLYASVLPSITRDHVRFEVPAGTQAWFVLADARLDPLDDAQIARLRQETLSQWDMLHQHTGYAGPWERQVKDSLRALRLLTHAPSGGVVAAGTLGLPEVALGARNYDYRYVWLRDTSMIVSALVRAGSKGGEERHFLDFLCSSRNLRRQDGSGVPLPPFLTLDGEPPPPLSRLDWQGYRGAQPVWFGNGAGEQLQLDGIANVLLAAKQVYNRDGDRPHWDTVAELADFLADHWQQPDHGIWEEAKPAQYTTGKVVAAVALRFLAEHSTDAAQASRWRHASADIEHFVESECRTAEGAYASIAGGSAVDVSAALFPVWDYCEADSPAMRATMSRLESDASAEGLLYRRHLECFDASREGVFLAGTLWVAQYWVMRGEVGRAERILQAAMEYSNDLGLFAEEADPTTGDMLGNFPQAFVHAALIGLIVDLRAAGQSDGS